MTDPTPSPLNPFPGLRPFEVHENHLFFGREAQTDELLRRLRLNRFLAVIGTRGSGKSSLVRAGLLPDLYGGLMVKAGSSWRVTVFRPGSDPIHNLAAGLIEPDVLGARERDSTVQTGIVEMTLRRSALGLVEAVRQARIPPTENLLIVVDQFEELFRFKPASSGAPIEDEPAAFVKLLLNAARQDQLPIYIMITMRSDYLGNCAQFRDLPETINEGMYLIPQMTRDQRREAITGPVAVGGGQIGPRLVNRLLNDATENPDQLPILQHALMRTWDFWMANHSDAEPIDLRHYEAIGAMTEALSLQAEEAYDELSGADAQLIAEKMFKRLTEKGPDNRDARRPSSVRELCEVAGASERELHPVIEVFRRSGRSFLMPSFDTPLSADSIIDISYENLIRGWHRLRRWVDEEAASAEVYSRLAETAQLRKLGKAGLWRDPDLQLALDWRKRTQPAPTWAQRYHAGFQNALEFLDESEISRDSEIAARQGEARTRRRLRNWAIAALVVGCIVSWVFLSIALSAKKKAEAAKRVAVEQERAARSGALRVRKQNLDDMSTMLSMAERLVELTEPEEATTWLELQADPLLQLRKYEEAIQAYESVIELEPQNATARAGLGYIYLVTGKADKALEQTDAALERDPTIWIGYQNRGIALAGLGRYKEAAASIRKSIDMFQHAVQEFRESELSPDITKATGRTTIDIGERAERAVSVCELANLEAFAGGDEFTLRLAEAEKQVQPIDPYLTAVNWAWLHLKARPQDYGALAAQGAWWERAGFRPWAKQAFYQFQSKYSESPEPRYAKLAAWVSDRLKELKDEKLPDEHPDAETLAFDAFVHELQGEIEKAQDCLDAVIKMEPDNGSFLLLRAWFFLRQEQYEASKADCEAVLKVDPRSASAYKCRALARQGLDARKAEIEDDFQKALEHNPPDGETMKFLSELIEEDRPDEALRLLKQALKAQIDLKTRSLIHSQMAAKHQANDHFQEALQSIEAAIAIESDQNFYETRAEIERKLGKPDSEINQHLAAGYRVVGDTEAKQAKDSDAFKAYWRSLEVATREASTTAPQEQEELAILLPRISAAIERLGSKEKAVEFWKIAIESGQWDEVRELFESEARRLSTAK